MDRSIKCAIYCGILWKTCQLDDIITTIIKVHTYIAITTSINRRGIEVQKSLVQGRPESYRVTVCKQFIFQTAFCYTTCYQTCQQKTLHRESSQLSLMATSLQD